MSALERVAEIFEKVLDEPAGFLAVSDIDHKMIHEGKMFNVVGNSGALNAAAEYYITILTPPASSGIDIHFKPASLSATANIMLLQIAKGVVPNEIGTPVTPVNRNDKLAATHKAKLKVWVGSTVTTAGATVDEVTAGSGGLPSRLSGGGSPGGYERELLPDTYYSVLIKNIGASTESTGYYNLQWYEAENAD